MKVLLVSFIAIFAFTQFIFWIKGFLLPLPLSILGGACLAIASNRFPENKT